MEWYRTSFGREFLFVGDKPRGEWVAVVSFDSKSISWRVRGGKYHKAKSIREAKDAALAAVALRCLTE